MEVLREDREGDGEGKSIKEEGRGGIKLLFFPNTINGGSTFLYVRPTGIGTRYKV